MQKTLFITGSDTEVGKTVITTAIAAYWQKYYPQLSWGIMKPIQSGKGDREWYQQLFSLQQSELEMTPLYFTEPLAPPIAAAKENRSVDLAVVWRALCTVRSQRDCIIVESLGGLGSPVTEELTVADLAGDWRLDTILVVPVKLGAIGQTVANVALARQAKVELKGIILNCTQRMTSMEIENWAPRSLIESLTNTPVLGYFPYVEELANLDYLADRASALDWERCT